MQNVTVEEIKLHYDKFTLIKIPTVVNGKEHITQISLSGHNHSESKISRVVERFNKRV